MHSFRIKGRTFVVPSTLNEMTGSQLAWLNDPARSLTPWTVFFRLVNHPRNSYASRLWLAWWILYNNYLVELLDQCTLRKLTWQKQEIPMLQWFDLVHLCTEFTDQTPFLLVPYRRLLWYVSPGDACKNLTFGEFLEADQAQEAYLTTKDEIYLNQLVAYLYLPVGARLWPWLHRRLGLEASVDARAKRLAKIPLSKRISVLHFYAGSRRALTLSHPNIFPPVDPDEEQQEKTQRNLQADYRDWFNTIAQTPLNNAATYLLPIWEVVSSMESKVLEAKRIEAEFKKNKP